LQQFDNGAVVYQAGGFSLFQETAAASGQTFTLGSAGGGFVRYTGFELAAIPASATSSTSPPTGCTVVQIPQPVTNVFVGGSGVFLDAGKVTLNGPTASGITNAVLTELDNSYSLEFAGFGATINGKLTAGSYTINGAGGADVGAFNASLNVPNPLTVTGGLPSTVNRSSGLTISWTGGNSSDAVVVTGEATNAVNNVQTGAAFVCYTTAGAGSLNVSSSILNQLPAAAPESTANQNSLTSLGVSWYTGATSGNGLFSAPLTAGGSISGSFSVSAITADAPTYQ